MRKYFRKIVVDNKEYDWLYSNSCDYYSNVKIFEIWYHDMKKVSKRKRIFFKEFDIDIFDPITPIQVEELIRCGSLLTKQGIRRRKLKKLNGLR